MSTLFCLFFVSCCLHFAFSITTISNIEPRYDTAGNYVNAHDGCLVQFNDTYYLYGTVYENCTQPGSHCNGKCGYYGNTFSVYSSKDLMEWELLSNNVLPELSIDNDKYSYWESNVGYNNLTKQYVMIYWSGHYQNDNKIAVAVSSAVGGPFINLPPIETSMDNIGSTVQLFVDHNGDGYVRYNTHWESPPSYHVIEKLTPNWLNSTGKYSVIFTDQTFAREGGGIFYMKQNNKYYVMIGSDCCFCEWGGDAIVFTATGSPLNQWNIQTRVNETNYCSNNQFPNMSIRTSGDINPCSPNNYTAVNYTLPSQQFSVSTLRTNNGNVYMYNGENFESSSDGLKSHDLQTWIPLEFDNDGNIVPMKWQNQWTAELVSLR